MKDLTTLAYFSVDANADGTLNQSGSGWNGYESQDLVNLVNRSHAAGDRVVLTVTCFSQSSLDAITSDPNAPARLSAALIAAVSAKNLDGVNFDFEGEGSGDRSGLTSLITKVSAALHGANPHWQVTMATYASAAADSAGFYDVAALAPAVDGFFVMAYDMNDRSVPSATAPLVGGGYNDTEALQEFTAVVPASKVILGVPYYGYDWPTTDGTRTAQATGGESPLSDGVIASSGHPDLLGSLHPDAVDRLPGGYPVARDVLRRSDLAGPQGPAGQLVPHRRPRDLGPRHGRQRPGRPGRPAGQRPGGQGLPDRTDGDPPARYRIRHHRGMERSHRSAGAVDCPRPRSGRRSSWGRWPPSPPRPRRWPACRPVHRSTYGPSPDCPASTWWWPRSRPTVPKAMFTFVPPPPTTTTTTTTTSTTATADHHHDDHHGTAEHHHHDPADQHHHHDRALTPVGGATGIPTPGIGAANLGRITGV